MTGIAVLTEALARGGKILWDPPDRPRLLAPPILHGAIKGERETVKEILRRASIFREQAERFIRHGKALPILALSEHPGGDGCWSCGVTVEAGHFRCDVCALSVRLALGEMP